MKKVNWKSGVEFVGFAAVVASLIFVGLQVKQDKTLAHSQAFNDLLSNKIELAALIAEHPHVWRRGNSGEDLDEAELTVYQMLVSMKSSAAVFEFAQLRTMEVSANTSIYELAVFLHRNPGARTVWEEIAQDRARYVDALRTRSELASTRASGSAAFIREVRQNIETLDQMFPESTEGSG